jgi:hypothetical protein
MHQPAREVMGSIEMRQNCPLEARKFVRPGQFQVFSAVLLHHRLLRPAQQQFYSRFSKAVWGGNISTRATV